MRRTRGIVAGVPWNLQSAIIWPPYCLQTFSAWGAWDQRTMIEHLHLSWVQRGFTRRVGRREGTRHKRKAEFRHEGGLPWPFGAFQVICVLVALLPTAAFSPQCVLRVLVDLLRIENAIFAKFERNGAGLADWHRAVKA